jgi:hypothetical protein
MDIDSAKPNIAPIKVRTGSQDQIGNFPTMARSIAVEVWSGFDAAPQFTPGRPNFNQSFCVASFSLYSVSDFYGQPLILIG